jgi:hypothetical protein
MSACTTIPKPTVSYNVLQDSVYPCIQVVFPEMVEYNGTTYANTEEESTSIHNIKMPAKPYYDITILKRSTTSPDIGWSLVPISDQYDESAKLYDIPPAGDFDERSAAVVFAEKNKELYLRAVVGEFTRPDTVYMILIDRLIQKEQYLHLFSADTWRESVTGKRFIDDMKAQADWYYSHTEVIDCNMNPNVDKIIK